MTTRFLITGPSGVGKSTLACSLYVRLRMDGVDAALHELDPWSDTHGCILGAKPWSMRNKRSGQDVYEDYQRGVTQFMRDDRDVVIGDMEGSLEWRYNQLLQGSAHHGILLQKHAGESSLHRELLGEINIPLLAEVTSVVSEDVEASAGMAVTGLQRSLLPIHPQVGELANLIWQTTRQQ
jgi:hypothetical protein